MLIINLNLKYNYIYVMNLYEKYLITKLVSVRKITKYFL